MFGEVEKLQALMAPFDGDYWIAGGWAVDMFLGKVTREHKDIEAAIRRDDQKALLGLPGLARAEYAKDHKLHPWEGERLSLPLHELYLHFENGATLEILLNEFDGSDWVFRRNPRVRRSAADFMRGHALPVAVPLLYKSKDPRQKDEGDFALCAPKLPEAERAWLRAAIALDHPLHPWLESLAPAR